jgi:predicted ATP-grasp superfamily ATP-dependent carboligase
MNIILISDIFHRKVFDVISIIHSKFPENKLILGLPSIDKLSFIKASILYKGNIEYLNTRSIDEFYKCLNNISNKYFKDKIIFIPVEEETTLFFLRFISIYGNLNFSYLLPELTVFETVRNKFDLNKYCIEYGINSPHMFHVYELKSLPECDYPILLKPCIGSGSKGLIRLLSSVDLTEDIYKQVQNKEYLAQELIPNGKEVKGAFFLCREGEIIGAYCHERIRTSPPNGGVTILSKITTNEQIISEGSKLLKSLKWEGLIMLEFLYDPKSDCYKIIEANPRLWGSIMLSEYSGANLLENYILICMGKEIKKEIIKENVYIRWLFPADVLNYLKSGFRIKDFWKMKDTCFINWTYAPKISAIFYNVISIFNFRNISRYFRK